MFDTKNMMAASDPQHGCYLMVRFEPPIHHQISVILVL
jgi:tubulin beta